MSKKDDVYRAFREFNQAHEQRLIQFFVPEWIYTYLREAESPINGAQYNSPSEICKDIIVQQLLDVEEFSLAKRLWDFRTEELKLWHEMLMPGFFDDDSSSAAE